MEFRITVDITDRKQLDTGSQIGLTEEAEEQLRDAVSGYGKVLDIECGPFW